MNLSYHIGKILPRVDQTWNILATDTTGKILSASTSVKTSNAVLDVFVRSLRNNCTKVQRELHTTQGLQQITSMFDANGKLIHSIVKNNGTVIEFSRNNLKKLKIYKISQSKILGILKKLVTKR